MKITVVGTGYVGLVAGACFADYGNQVYCVDIDEQKIENLKKSILPIYEPGLSEIVQRNHERGRLRFTTVLSEAVTDSSIIFIAVGTPDGGDGRPDLRGVRKVAESIAQAMNSYKIIVNKSTVPVGTGEMVAEIISQNTEHEFDVVSNPEFLREGRAVDDFMKPERVVIGASSERAAAAMREVYGPFVRETDNPIYTMNVKSAEITKYACNTFLAMKITFANEVANLCDALGANYLDVKHGLGSDSRIGKKFLNAGIGYGGSCFPKDVRAFEQTAQDTSLPVPLISQIEPTNERQKLRLLQLIDKHYTGANLQGKTFAVWGLAFKAGTDDMRDAPSIPIIQNLVQRGVIIKAHDPVARHTAHSIFKDTIQYSDTHYEPLENADALLVLTEWPVYRESDFEKVKSLLKEALIFDGRNLYERQRILERGFTYYGIGTNQ
ncbi:MAG: UDP-glucose/GDP-mannose dehydrogenase family protein [Leptospiraceae bacterium]|nr:UDP-glucose/GDP-mannose dehydrogenase family protein [Leptospiraceae bacterium]